MEFMFLIIKLGYGSVVIPEKYPKEQCEKLAAGYNGASGYCIPAPALFNCRKVNPLDLNSDYICSEKKQNALE